MEASCRPLEDWNCGNHGSKIDSRRSDSPSLEESSWETFMEILLVTPRSPPNSQSSSTEPNVVPIPDSESDADTVPRSDSVSTSRYLSRVHRPPDRLTPWQFYCNWYCNCYLLSVYRVCSVLAWIQARVYRVHVRPEAKQCVGSGVLAACILFLTYLASIPYSTIIQSIRKDKRFCYGFKN